MRAIGTIFAVCLGLGTSASAQEVRFTCYADGNECETYRTILDAFEAENPGITVAMDVVAYRAGILDGLPVTLEAGEGPDIARVTDVSGLSRHLLNMRPYLENPAYFEEAFFAPALVRMRSDNDADGIFGFPNQMTMTIGYVNATLFDQAGVDIPGPEATWDDWAEATGQVQAELDLYSGMVMDRSFHRALPAAIAYGASFVGDDGMLGVGGDGVTELLTRMVAWHEDGLMPPDVWPSASGPTVVAGAELFENAQTAFLMSGSWLLSRFDRNIGTTFDWRAVPNPCGSAGCVGGMAGGSNVVGIRYTDHPEAVAKVIEYLATPEALTQFAEATLQIPGNAEVAGSGLNYASDSDAVRVSLNVIGGELGRISDETGRILVHPRLREILNSGTTNMGLAISGEMTVDQAVERINSELAGG